MGMMLMAAFKGITSNISTTEWIRLQPQLALGTAVWFIALGTLLMVDGRTAMKLARYGTLFYIFFTVVNGMLMQPYVHIPYAGIFIVGFVATGVLMGVILAIAVQKMELKPV
jgi:FtsH-binding integral membrane protein